MRASRRIATTFIIAPALFAACNRKPRIQNNDANAALKALGSTVPAPEYGREFWQPQHDQNTDAWREAMKLCSESILANYPNCLPINEIFQADVQKQAAKERQKNAHFDEMTRRGYDFDAARGLWFRETDMVARKCYYMPLSPNDPADLRSTFQCPAGTQLPKGEK
jgi:hypothetical protein